MRVIPGRASGWQAACSEPVVPLAQAAWVRTQPDATGHEPVDALLLRRKEGNHEEAASAQDRAGAPDERDVAVLLRQRLPRLANANPMGGLRVRSGGCPSVHVEWVL
jgi:hypothetical protein